MKNTSGEMKIEKGYTEIYFYVGEFCLGEFQRDSYFTEETSDANAEHIRDLWNAAKRDVQSSSARYC